MRPFEFDTESFLEFMESMAAVIKINCSQILPVYKQVGLLYRGIDLTPGSNIVFNGRSPSNRKPLGFTMQTEFDEILVKHGLTALRSNSIFCSSSKDLTSMFGTEYIIFPMDDFKFSWSPDVYDMNIDFEGMFDNEYMSKQKKLDKILEIAYSYTDKDLPRAIRSGHEIMIHGRYYAVMNEEFAPGLHPGKTVINLLFGSDYSDPQR